MTQSMDFRSRARSVREAARKQLQQLRDERLAQKTRRPPGAPETTAPDLVVPEDVGPEEVGAEGVGVVDPAPEVAVADLASSEPAAPEVELAEDDSPEDLAAEPLRAEAARQPVRPAPKRKPAPRKAARPAPDSPEERQIRRAALAEMFDDAPATVDLPAAPAAPASAASEPITPESAAPEISDAVPMPEPVAEMQAPVAEVAEDDLVSAEADDLAEEATTEVVLPPAVPASDFGDLASLPGAGPGLIWMLQQCGIRSLSALAAADVTRLSADLGLVGQILDVGLWRDYAQRQLQDLDRAS